MKAPLQWMLTLSLTALASSLKDNVTLARRMQMGPRRVSLYMTISNVNYASLIADASIVAGFVHQMKEAVAFESGGDVVPEDVEVFLTSGSVDVRATITTDNTATAAIVHAALGSSMTLHRTISTSLILVPRINSVATSAIEAQRGDICHQTPPTLSPCTAATQRATTATRTTTTSPTTITTTAPRTTTRQTTITTTAVSTTTTLTTAATTTAVVASHSSATVAAQGSHNCQCGHGSDAVTTETTRAKTPALTSTSSTTTVITSTTTSTTTTTISTTTTTTTSTTTSTSSSSSTVSSAVSSTSLSTTLLSTSSRALPISSSRAGGTEPTSEYIQTFMSAASDTSTSQRAWTASTVDNHSDDSSFQPFVFVVGASALATGGLAGAIYFWHLCGQLQKAHAGDRAKLAELEKHRNEGDKNRGAAEAAVQELQRCMNESQVLQKKAADWQREAEILCRERDTALTEIQRQRARVQEQEARFKAAAAGTTQAQALPSSPRGLEDLYTEIKNSIRQIQKVPLSSRASELRLLKRSYHPDAQKLKSQAVQLLFTQLSQYINSYCEVHLRRSCPVCQSSSGSI